MSEKEPRRPVQGLPSAEEAIRPQLPSALVIQKSKISKIWIIPVIAILIGLGLIYTAISNRGPTLTISFKSANGIEVKKTKVKYKDITIGQVRSVTLSDDLEHVLVTVKLKRQGGELISSNSRFWIERPRLQGMSVTGLDTLFSGSYIAVDPGVKVEREEDIEEFTGLENPPRIKEGEQGKVFTLRADTLGSLDYGSPVYYRGIEVGQIVGYQLEDHGAEVDIDIFVRKPYDDFVKQTSKFWLISGVELDLDSSGVHVLTESMASVIMGGVAFIDMGKVQPSAPASSGDRFHLYDTQADAQEEHYEDFEEYLLRFTHSARGLSVGAPVEFKGFKLGKVIDIGVEFDWSTQEVYIPVKIQVEGGRLARVAKGLGEVPAGREIHLLVERGLRAQLQSGNLITGQLFVALDFFHDVQPTEIQLTADGQQLIPTLPNTVELLMEQATKMVTRIQELPIEQIGIQAAGALSSIRKAGDQFKRVLKSGDIKDTLVQAAQVAKETTLALDQLQKLLDQDSQVLVEVRRTLRDLGSAARSVKQLADQLERDPQSLFRGRE